MTTKNMKEKDGKITVWFIMAAVSYLTLEKDPPLTLPIKSTYWLLQGVSHKVVQPNQPICM